MTGEVTASEADAIGTASLALQMYGGGRIFPLADGRYYVEPRWVKVSVLRVASDRGTALPDGADESWREDVRIQTCHHWECRAEFATPRGASRPWYCRRCENARRAKRQRARRTSRRVSCGECVRCHAPLAARRST